MRPAYGMGRRSFSRPGALRFTAAPCSRLAKRRAVQQGGRPAIHSGAAPPHGSRRPAAQPHLTTTPDDRRRSPRSTRQAADSPTARRKPASQQPPTTGHEMAGKPARQPPAGPPSPAPSCINPPGHRPSAPSRITPRNRRAPPSSRITPRNRRPPPSSRIPPRNRRPPPSSRITPRNCRAPPSTTAQPRFTTTPGDRRRSPHFTATPTTGHEMAGKPAWQPPAGPPRPAVPLHNPPGHQRAPPFPSGKSAYQFPRRAPLRMPDRYIRSVVGPPRSRRPPPPGKARTSSSALARPLPSGKREPRPQRAPSSRITPRNRRAPPSTAAQPRFTTTPGDRRHSPRSTRQAADSPTARRKPASQQPPTTGHEMAGKPARQPPAGPPRPAVLSHNPPGHRPSAPSCIIPRNRRAPPSTAVQPRFTTTPGDRRRSPHFTATPRPVTKWRANRHGSHPPEPPPLCALLHKPAGPPATAPPFPLREKRVPVPPARAALSHNSPEPPPPAVLSHNPPEPPPPRRPLA